ncbi:MBL fold metallo-hydrolase [Pseudonocardia sp. KRD291]|uniref:MBL fold metallo-hydrolase n=1 Tax=Pseudonocardia sp. KRD291 TaxID=2792007 RepID=UPI001C49D9CE|nr:MBL fold metallo-hydrolase [Pseudonocardia sp. KRD291]MBW0106256.1 MBL fold metallo-hydrolase [Pseudonocardia sp. KRD291]
MSTTHPAYGVLRQAHPLAAVLLQNNPGHMTLEGTNTWVLAGPGATDRIVVDPGEDDGEHLEHLADGPPVSLILLTHHHHDHSGGAPRFAEMVGAPVRARTPELCSDAPPLTDGETISAAGLPLYVMATPGHTADSTSFLIGGNAPALLSGDTILGRGTTVIAQPDGGLGPYLESLRRLAELPSGVPVLPGHGPDLPDTAEIAAAYLAHREQRLGQVRAALQTLGPDATARRVVEVVYADVDEKLWDAAEWSVTAQLEYLRG